MQSISPYLQECAIITETEYTYVMIESTLWLDDIEDISGLLLLLQVVQRSIMRQENGAGEGLGIRLQRCSHA